MPDLTASPGRAPHPGNMQNQQNSNMQRQGHMKEPVLLQGDFRKVSGISSEIFRQIETVENDHDPSTAAALEVKLNFANAKKTLLLLIKYSIKLHFICLGCRETWRDDCASIGAAMHWQSSFVRSGPKVFGKSRFTSHRTNGGNC